MAKKKASKPKRGETAFDSIQHPKKRAFLLAYAECGSITRAAKAVDIDRTSVWLWRFKLDGKEEFCAAFELAYAMSGDLLEEEAIRRAREGCRKKRFHNGFPILDPETGEQYEEWEYSDTLLIFLLKGAKPHKYRERYEVSRPADELDKQFNDLVGGLDRFGKSEDLAATTGETAKPPSNGNGRNGANGNGNGKH